VRIGSDPATPKASNGRSAGINSKKPQLPSTFKHLLAVPKKPQPVDRPVEQPREGDPLPPDAVRRARRDAEREEPLPSPSPSDSPLLDPLVCALSHPRALETLATVATPPSTFELPVEALLERLVRRVAVGGTGRRGTARLELGAGGLDGTTVTIHADENGEVSVEVELAPGARGDWHEGLKEKLERRGLTVKSVEVR
jgi:hypothetical protein